MISIDKCNRLIDEGFSLITSDDKKIPNCATPGFPGKWKGSQTQPISKDEFKIRYDWPHTKFAGIVTGYDDLECIDIDLKVFSTAAEQVNFWDEYLSFLQDNIYDFDLKFVIYKTQNAGYHILYKSKRVCGNSKIAALKGHKEAVIESRGVGGYVIVYNNNVGEKTYKDIEYISDEDREIIWSISQTYNYVDETIIEVEPIIKKLKIETGTLAAWDDFNNKNSIFDIIGNEFTTIRNITDKYIIKREGAKSAHSGYVYKNSGCMYLFSTGTIYPHEKLISPFHAYCIKNHNGNFSDAAKQIYKDGYGDRLKPKEDIEEPKKEVNIDELIFPVDIFPENIKRYILTCNETLNSSVDYLGASMLWVTSIVIGNSINVEVKKGWIEVANLWIAMVGKAGIGKTPSISNITFPIQKINGREIRKYIKHKDKYDKYNELDKKEKALAEEVQKPRKTQFIVNDITLEALIELHDENKNGVGVLKDELAGWLKEMNRYRQGSDLEHWLSSWNGKEINLNRKTSKSSFVDKAFIPVMGGIQPGVLDNFYTDENKDNGFIDRLLFSFPNLNIEPYNENEMSEHILSWYESYIVAFYELMSREVNYNEDGEIMPYNAKFNSEARKEWIRIFNKITELQNSDEENEYLKSMLPKQKSYIPRFALLINILTNYDANKRDYYTITLDSILKAEKLSNYFIAMAKKIKINSTEVNGIRKIIKVNDGKSTFDIFKAIYEKDKSISASQLSESLGVSRRMIYKYISKLNENKV